MDFYIIKKAIDNWDPIELLIHAPDDEYNGETKKIAEKINNQMDENEVGLIIYNTFKDAFGLDTFTNSLQECVSIAKIILQDKNNRS